MRVESHEDGGAAAVWSRGGEVEVEVEMLDSLVSEDLRPPLKVTAA